MIVRTEGGRLPIHACLSTARSGFAVVALALSCVAASAQPASTSPSGLPVSQPPRFDIVSVRRNNSGSKQMFRQSASDSDGIVMTNVAPAMMVYFAYRINEESLLTGLPDWAWTERYDLGARVDPAGVPAYQKLTNTQRGQMLEPVLAERFHLQVHRETKDRPIFQLVAAKSGVRMKLATPGEIYPARPAGGNGFVHGGTIFTSAPGELTGQGATMTDLATALSNAGSQILGRLVVDHTGLSARYDFTLRFAEPDSSTESADDRASALFTAIQEQLGIRMEPAKAPVEYVVVDHMERPEEN